MYKIDEIVGLLKSIDTEDIFEGLIQAGKGMFIELEDEVVKFFEHPCPLVRGAAIRVVGFYWQFEKYKDIAWNMYLIDEDEETRSHALFSYSELFAGKNDKVIMNTFYQILCDRSAPLIIRATAFNSILTVSPIDTVDWPDDPDFDTFEDDIDWEFFEKLIDEAE